MIRAAFSILFAALAWPALRWRTLPDVQKDPAFTACWREEFKKSEARLHEGCACWPSATARTNRTYID